MRCIQTQCSGRLGKHARLAGRAACAAAGVGRTLASATPWPTRCLANRALCSTGVCVLPQSSALSRLSIASSPSGMTRAATTRGCGAGMCSAAAGGVNGASAAATAAVGLAGMCMEWLASHTLRQGEVARRCRVGGGSPSAAAETGASLRQGPCTAAPVRHPATPSRRQLLCPPAVRLARPRSALEAAVPPGAVVGLIGALIHLG